MTEKPLLVQPVPALDRLPMYSVGRPPYETDLVLDFNESLAPLPLDGAPPSDVGEVNLYPWTAQLESQLAARIGVDADRVIVTCGADDALERSVRSVCCPGRRAVMVKPTYGMPWRYAITTGAEIATVEWWRGPFPVDEVCEAAEGAALLFLVSPNNPTGGVVTRDEFIEVVTRLPRTLILHDQAYREFSDPEFDLTDAALAHPNVVLVRTFSKAWGGAGLRAGYAVGDPRVVDWLRRIGQPFPVSRLTLDILETAVTPDAEPALERVNRIRSQRDSLAEILTDLGAETLPSQANFVAARFDDAAAVRAAMASLGIAVRGFPGRSELNDWLRTTMPGDEQNFDRLVGAFRTVLKPEALLFDLDGVLADESVSYREAIVATAAVFGLDIDRRVVNAAKAAGDANNDWELTHRLLTDAGIDTTLAEVTARFESIYQGTDAEPGLRRHERLLVEHDTLTRLAERLPLAVVTGRPRRDAERFLAEHGITDLFRAVVAMEDAPAKPDPAPVRTALEGLGLRRAWMVGDTPDDIRAARRAAVLPIGIVAPGDDPDEARAALASSGAARILSTVDELLEILP
ncbi:MAG: aminotransferase class I/II-fold pyridoxal phosphate-dependent enzyme [Candidatus Sulfomarinibacteraceae bacterium]